MTTSAFGVEPAGDQAATDFADKIFTAALGTMETFALYLGERLGWLDALASGPLTATELAERTQTAERDPALALAFTRHMTTGGCPIQGGRTLWPSHDGWRREQARCNRPDVRYMDHRSVPILSQS